VDINAFNAPGSKIFIYLMSTRAGGLGVNLQTADTCILYDSDWNPQVDMQAMARVHRIGQKKKVHIYRLVTAGTMEERIIQRSEKKLFLDQMVNRGSTANSEAMEKLGTKELLAMLTFGADAIFQADDGEGGGGTGGVPTEEQIAAIIDRKRGEAVDPAAASIASSSASVASKGTTPKDASPNGGEMLAISHLPHPQLTPPSHPTLSAAAGGGLRENCAHSAAGFSAEETMVSIRTLQGSYYSKKQAGEDGEDGAKGSASDFAVERAWKNKSAKKKQQQLEGEDEGGEQTEGETAEAKQDETQEKQEKQEKQEDETPLSFSAVVSKVEVSPSKKGRARNSEKKGKKKVVSMKDIGSEWAERAKRKVVSRLVQVGNHQVLKKNMYDLEDGEPSVYDKELAHSKDDLDGGSKYQVRVGAQVAGRDYEHVDRCLKCWEGGSLICCDFCPAAYHIECLGFKSEDELPKTKW
jgi:hypothetical protein